MPNYAETQLQNLDNPAWQSAQLAQRFGIGLPQLQRLLGGVRTDLNKRGMFSSSPLASAGARATGDFTTGLTSDFYSGLDSQRMDLISLVEQMREAERQRKSQEKMALWGGLGNLVGTAAGFAIPGMGQANLLQQMMGMFGGGGGGGNSYVPQNPMFNPGYLDRR